MKNKVQLFCCMVLFCVNMQGMEHQLNWQRLNKHFLEKNRTVCSLIGEIGSLENKLGISDSFDANFYNATVLKQLKAKLTVAQRECICFKSTMEAIVRAEHG